MSLGAFIPACGGVDAAPEPIDPDVDPRGLPPRFMHGVASGDPLPNAVILWTRVTPSSGSGSMETGGAAPEGTLGNRLEVEWRIARDPELDDIVTGGSLTTDESVDYTVKVDVVGLESSTTYYFDFRSRGVRSEVGRTRTLPAGEATHARLAVTSCANFPAGFFNVYRAIAERSDIDLVVHLGDYLYEYPNGTLGDGTVTGRLPEPNEETVTLASYRVRHAQYKLDLDLQELHRQHAMIAVWDDHEVANNAYRDGAINHQADVEGDWAERKANAMRAYFEWMPIRPYAVGDTERVHRAFAFGDLFDLVMLDTRLAGRDPRVTANCDFDGIVDPNRTLLGAAQEEWLFETLRASSARGARWRLVGQQVMFGQLSDIAQGCVTHPDQWDGYEQSRARVLAALKADATSNVVILTGDAHSSWAFELAENPFDADLYDGATGQGSLAVEFVTPGVSSPGSGALVAELSSTHPHVKFAETSRRGYILLDVTPEQVQAEWYFVRTVDERDATEELAMALKVLDGSSHLVTQTEASSPKARPPRPAP